MSTAGSDPLDALAEEYLRQYRAGGRVGVEAFADSHPEHRQELLEILPAMVALEQWKRDRESTASSGRSLHVPPLERLGDYRILREVGRGGMGVVFKAYDTALHRDVALKLIPPNVANEEEKLARFLREARSAAKLQHPGIVPIYFAGAEDGVSFIVMGYVDGKTLGTIIEQEAPLPSANAVRIVRDLADALQHAHGRGIIHRDIKPENLMIATDGTVRIMDFGLARSFTIEQGKITDTGI